MHRNQTKIITVGGLPIGGASPVSVQSMCSTKTEDIDATLAQIEALTNAGCDIIRLAVPNERAARALPSIRRGCKIPMVADIHFDYKIALAVADAGADCLRINPGNIGSEAKIREVVAAAKYHDI
ncbi:MAG: flavodoxin-dependent (E)-4-hydroxy-3-methylbut-2-enyl-diphosphate synthase, partial [Oscillospiraceae bacterium]